MSVLDVLSLTSDAEGHVLSMTANTNCQATVTVDEFSLIELVPNPEIRTDCQINYTVTDELHLQASGTMTVKVITLIFADGFESGNTTAWDEPSS